MPLWTPPRYRDESLTHYANRLKNWRKEGYYDALDAERREAEAQAAWYAANPAPERKCDVVSAKAGRVMMCKTPERCREACWVAAELEYRHQLRSIG